MTTILLSAPYMLAFLDRFKPILEGYGLDLITPEVHERMEENELISLAGQFDGAICGDDRFTERVLKACLPRLKVISKWGTGVDSIDADACSRLGIHLARTLNAFTLPVSDSVMGYMLAFARKLPWMNIDMKAGRWDKILGRSLSECTLGVIGVGNIGKAVIHRAHAFGMNILANDIIAIDPVFLSDHHVTMTSLVELVAGSDFISVNCDLNPTSVHLINDQLLTRVKPGAILINTARGPIVDEPALVRALKSGLLAGAALDVFEQEPLPKDSPLLTMENVMLAPHNSNSSPVAWEQVHENTIRNLLDGLGIPSEGLQI
ncbi:MAG TPA: phosphoglycerate dehydrogenase [Anaerolineales bacterium]|nr:phosphoglycerate dehydrogenase [Anaerolineales bacterium]